MLHTIEYNEQKAAMTTIQSPSLTDLMVDFVLRVDFQDLSEEVVRDAKRALLDTLGVALRGSVDQGTQMLLRVSGTQDTSGPSTILGAGTSTTPTLAGLVNGYAAHSLDYDDSQHRLGTHMSAPVVSAVTSVAELGHASGRDLLAAYVLGFELACRLGRMNGFARHLAKQGIHATGYLGHLGAAAGAGRLLGLDSTQMRHSLGIAASQASGLMRTFGTMTKALGAGNAACNGIRSALLAKQGFTGPDQILDGEKSLIAAAGGEPNRKDVEAGLGTEFEVSYNTLKEYACAGWRNPVIEASIKLAEIHDLGPGDIERVTVWAYVDRAHLPNYPNPQTGLESKFSAEHAVAVGIVDRAGGIAQFTDERVGDDVLTELRRKVILDFDPDLEPYQIRVIVETQQGTELSHFVPKPRGDYLRPLSWDELAVKFSANATDVLGEKEISGVIEAVGSVESLEDVQDLMDLCRGAGPGL